MTPEPAAKVFKGIAEQVERRDHSVTCVDDRALLAEWKPRLQAPIPHAGSAGHHRLPVRFGSVGQTGHWAWLLGATILVANRPYTLLGIMPTNGILMATQPTKAGADSRALIKKWAALPRAHHARLRCHADLSWASMSYLTDPS